MPTRLYDQKTDSELSLIVKRAILPNFDVINAVVTHDYIDKKQIKPLIIALSHALEQLGLPVINRYNYRVNTPQEISGRFWLVGFVEDRNTTNSTITMAKIENGRPAISVLLLPAISSAYSAVGGYRAYQFALNKKVL